MPTINYYATKHQPRIIAVSSRYTFEITRDRVFCLRKSERHQDNEKQEIYEFHAPSSILVSPNKLALQQQDVSSLDEIFNLVISCIRQNSTSVAAVKEYDDYHRDQQGNA